MNTAELLRGYSKQIAREGTTELLDSTVYAEILERTIIVEGSASTDGDNAHRIPGHIMIGPEAASTSLPQKARVYFEPVAAPANETTLRRAMFMHLADPTVPLYVIASPGAPGNETDSVTRSDIFAVRSGDFVSVVAPTLNLLYRDGIKECEFSGSLTGADEAMSAVLNANLYDIKATGGIYIEPASTIFRGLYRYLKDTNRAMAVTLSPDGQAEPESAIKITSIRYLKKLRSLTDRAIEAAVSDDGFTGRLLRTYRSGQGLTSTVVYGRKSEVVQAEVMRDAAKFCSQKLPDVKINFLAVAELDDAKAAEDLTLGALLWAGIMSNRRMHDNPSQQDKSAVSAFKTD